MIKVQHIAFDGQLALLENSLSRYTRNLVQQLCALRPELRVSLLVFSERSADELRQQHKWLPAGATFVVSKGKETPYHLPLGERLRRRFWVIPRTTRRIGAQIFHGHYKDFPPPIGFKVVSTVHDVFQWQPELGRIRGPLDRLRRLLDRLIYRCATIVCVSDATLRDFLTYLDPTHPSIQRVYSGNDPNFSPLARADDSTILKKYGLESKRYFLYIGDLTPRKNVETLIRAFNRELPGLPPDFRLALSKGHWTVCKERDLVNELGLQDRVTFLGDIDEADLSGLYRGSYAFVFPSLYEGFGFPPIEAMASGVPVISTHNSSLIEVVGPAGLTFPNRDVRQLGGCLAQIVSDSKLYGQCVEKGLVQSARFSWETTARQVLQVYEQVLNR